MKIILLTKGQEALVDDDDFPVLSKLKWYATKGNAGVWQARRTDNGKGKTVLMHRFLLSPSKNMQIDHIDGNPLNNQRSNLRICTQSENLFNSRKRGTHFSSVYKGVYWEKDRKRWTAEIRKNGKERNLGRFKVEKEAALAYNKAALELFGDFAHLNEVPL